VVASFRCDHPGLGSSSSPTCPMNPNPLACEVGEVHLPQHPTRTTSLLWALPNRRQWHLADAKSRAVTRMAPSNLLECNPQVKSMLTGDIPRTPRFISDQACRYPTLSGASRSFPQPRMNPKMLTKRLSLLPGNLLCRQWDFPGSGGHLSESMRPANPTRHG
jgi:hypothetical protein